MESGKASRPLLSHCWYTTPHKLTLRSCCCYSLCTACCADIAYILSTAAASRAQRCYGDALKTAAIKATKKRQPNLLSTPLLVQHRCLLLCAATTTPTQLRIYQIHSWCSTGLLALAAWGAGNCC